MLRALGVRDVLAARDVLHANMCLVRDFAGAPLPPRPLAACLAQLRAAPAHLGAADGSGLASGLFLPDDASVLCPAAELTFDDAPWMSATLRGRGNPNEP